MPDPGADTVKISRRPAWHRLVTWSLVTLGVLCVLVAGPWFGGRWFAQSRLSAAKQIAAASPDRYNPADAVSLFEALDHVPDFIVYPVLVADVQKDGYEPSNITLLAMEARAFGGVRRFLLPSTHGLSFETEQPDPSAQRWVAKLPRSFLEDLWLAGHDPNKDRTAPYIWGSCLIRAVEPDSSRWKAFEAPAEESAQALNRLKTRRTTYQESR